MEGNQDLLHLRDALEKAGVQTSGTSPFWEWMHPESKTRNERTGFNGHVLYVGDIPLPKVAPVDIAEIRLNIDDGIIYFTFTLYFYTVLKDALEAEDFKRIHDTHEMEWFPKLREYFLDVSSRFSLEWDVEYDECIEDALCWTFETGDVDEIMEVVKAICQLSGSVA